MPRPSVETKYEPVVFRELFGNDHPSELEIGCGKGRFLFEYSRLNPGRNFLGIDRVGKWMKRRKARTERESLANIRFMKAEARAFLTEAVATGSVSVFHIYFPDPWPKRRHHKRRTVSEDFLRLLHSRLVPGGRIEMATDDANYFSEIKKGVAATAGLWENVRETVNERIAGGMIKTNYELKWEAEGRPLYYIEIIKKGSGPFSQEQKRSQTPQ